MRSVIPMVATTSSNHASSTSRPAMSSGSVMFSRAVSVGTRLNAWKTNPTLSRRSSVSRLSFSSVRSTSPTKTCPLVGVSRPARQCSNVDFPDPDGPMIAVNSPAARSTLTPPQRLDGGVALSVDLAEVDRSRGCRSGRDGRYGHLGHGSSSVDVGGTRRPSAGRSDRWARQVLNLRPLACEASALPLSYAPDRFRSLASRGRGLRRHVDRRSPDKVTAARARVVPPSSPDPKTRTLFHSFSGGSVSR